MMVYAGARTETASELKQLLSYGNLSDEQIFNSNKEYVKRFEEIKTLVDLSVANKLFFADDFHLLDEYKSILVKYFESEAQPLNFNNPVESAETINSFVKIKTKEKIKNLVDPNFLNSLTKLVLINVVYFKGILKIFKINLIFNFVYFFNIENWKHQFEICETHEENFFLKDGSIEKVQMMESRKNKFVLKIDPAGLKAKTCEFLYAGEQISMTIILPNQESNISEVEAQLNPDIIKQVLDNNGSIPVKVDVYMPKFNIEFKTEVSYIFLIEI